MEQKNISELHTEHKEWIQHLNFYKEDLVIYQKRIEEVGKNNTSKDVQAHIEHFQNQIIIQRNNIDELKHRVNEHEDYIMKSVKENPVASDHRRLNDHPKMREDFQQLEKVINELRGDINRFAAKWL